MFPLVCLFTRRRGVLVPLLILLALSLPWTHAALKGDEIWQEKAYLPGMSAIAVGVLGAILAASWLPTKRNSVLLGWLGAIGLALALFDGSALWSLLQDDYILFLALSALCLLLMFQQRGNLDGWWRAKGLGWLRSWGRLSYEIYLSHMFVVYTVMRSFKLSGGDFASRLWWYLLAVPSCWLLGATVERWLSRPCDRWLRRAATRAFGSRAA